MKTISIEELKDTQKIENLCYKHNEPVFVTKNREDTLVLMSVNQYNQLMKNAYEASVVLKGLEDVAHDRVKDGARTMRVLKEKYGM